MQHTNQITNCSIKLSDVFVCNFADFLTRFKNGLSAYYSSCSLDVRCRLCSKLCVLLSKMSIQQILIQLCGEILYLFKLTTKQLCSDCQKYDKHKIHTLFS